LSKHAKRQEQNTELVQALRQCDGEHVQCLVLARDDFWLAVSRFLRDLEVRLVEGHNTALVDLFDPLHARKVLAEFGRAFGRLPVPPAPLTSEQQRFLGQTVAGLTRDGKIISVRLSLFAEMVKGKPWTPATLKEVGGTEGIGARFLEDTFSAANAPAEHRLHQQAAQAVLRALLPEEGTQIRGHMRSYQELLEGSGYARQPRNFEDLLRILDTELRLITPTDPEAVGSGQSAVSRRKEAGSVGGQAGFGPDDGSSALLPNAPYPLPTAYYQLTHDYLVPALQQWLTRKQKETRRGRAELRLADRAALWNARPENRHLPAWWEWANIRLFTRRRDWLESQRHMMRVATRYHTLRSLLATVAFLVAATLGGWELHRQNANHADELVKRLLEAEISQVPKLLAEIEGYHRWADAQLVEITEDSLRTRTQQLYARLALLPVDRGQIEFLCGKLLDAKPEEFLVIRNALQDHGHEEAVSLLEQELRLLEQELRQTAMSKESRDLLAKRQANAAVALLGLGQADQVWPLLEHSEDPSLRTYLIHRFSRLGIRPQKLIQRLEDETVTSIRRALILSLGEYEDDELSLAERERLVPELLEWYRNDPDPGIHSAVDWLLRQWKEEVWLKQVNDEWAKDKDQREKRLQGIQQLVTKDKEKAPPQWYVNGQGQTMVVIPGPVKFLMGSPIEEPNRWDNETLHWKPIGHSFAIATKEVTVEQFLRFRKYHRYTRQYAPSTECPVIEVTWYQAAEYCNWLSKEEGIPEDQWCYLPNAAREYAEGMKLAPERLRRTGYRLPTEAEWEYACRAGAATSRFYGASGEMLEKYAWYWSNSKAQMWPVVLLKPNDLGLFDIYGNVWEWCTDIEDSTLIVTDKRNLPIRGGSYKSAVEMVRSANRNWGPPTEREFKNGMRVAKTCCSTR
jgi:formylglycine-generating enzyme required for sulfatase activity